MSGAEMSISVSWVLGIIGLLGGVIATLASIIYKSLSDRLAAQDKIIEHLRADVERMSKGCGLDPCHWRVR
ncbi:hypothetical protein JIN85_19270 [Luteolibacter pohnpeiensis]|uniref:Uncharacterized protein n=1 Tax=Luteolibacter pohnpeiensis TaxID=454153 RepID=A0A934SAS8_9BACT|nr:hypothetical protein [Luteolibacter pohnpeiensis]MBK1884565.1 hypothetical protein [Luteolibacter pohnpeiensis]